VELIAATLSGSAFAFSATASEKHPKGLVGLAHQCLVMDEVDGMSAGDRGGNQALMQMIKKSAIPIICICNDRMSQKVRSLANHCYDLKMNRPTRTEVIERAKQILKAEHMENVPLSVVEQIVDGSDCDIRQVINQLEGDSFDWTSTIQSYEKKDKSTMLNAFEACRLILAPKPGMTVSDRLDMFFVDYDMIPLMIQQNYFMFPTGRV
jgi:replication factor C subunit 1